MGERCRRLSIEDMGTHLEAECPSYCSLRDCAACINEIFTTARRLDRPRILVNFTATKVQIPISDLFALGKFVAEEGRGHIKLAVVASAQAVTPDRFFQTVAQNRGINVRVFVDDFDSALSWLESGEIVEKFSRFGLGPGQANDTK